MDEPVATIEERRKSSDVVEHGLDLRSARRRIVRRVPVDTHRELWRRRRRFDRIVSTLAGGFVEGEESPPPPADGKKPGSRWRGRAWLARELPGHRVRDDAPRPSVEP